MSIDASGDEGECPARHAELTATRDQAKDDSERALAHIVKIGPAITPASLRAFATALRKKLRNGDGTFTRDQVRAFTQRVKVVGREVRIRGCGANCCELKWRTRQDSNL